MVAVRIAVDQSIRYPFIPKNPTHPNWSWSSRESLKRPTKSSSRATLKMGLRWIPECPWTAWVRLRRPTKTIHSIAAPLRGSHSHCWSHRPTRRMAVNGHLRLQVNPEPALRELMQADNSELDLELGHQADYHDAISRVVSTPDIAGRNRSDSDANSPNASRRSRIRGAFYSRVQGAVSSSSLLPSLPTRTRPPHLPRDRYHLS